MTTDDEVPLGQMTAEDWGNAGTLKPPRERRPRTKPVAAPLDENFGELPAAVDDPPSETQDWENAARAFQRDHFRHAQRAAERWIAAVMGLLALFGGIAIVAGPDSDMISNSGIRWTVLALTVLAGIAAVVSLGMATLASRLPLRPGMRWDGEEYRCYVTDEVHAVLRRLLHARVSGFVAAAALFVGGGAILAAGPAHGGPPGPAPSVLVVRKSGQLTCGPLAMAGSAVTVGGRHLSDVLSITVVASC